MSAEHHTPGANVAAAAAPRVQEAGTQPASSAPPEDASSPVAAPEDTPSPATAPEAESGTTPTGKTTTAPPPPSAAAGTTEAPEEGVGVAAAVGTTPPGVKAGTGVDGGRPRKPVLAGAAIAGAVLIAVPLLLIGGAKDKERPDDGKALTGSDTVLNPDPAPAALDDYVAEKSSPSPSKEKPRKSEAPKPVVPAEEPRTSSPPKKKPKPKAAPKRNWSTETVSAPSVLEVKQAWTTNRIRMTMQTDGNLVVYNENGNAIWASMTFGDNHRAIFQTDGNLVIHNADDRPIWASKSHGHEGAQMVLRADGKVAIVDNGKVVWST
ncbi:mannose-binding protein [Streptomyces sp. NPDC048639]|uniref:mannose-binding protein n=1 Tax=Streptomyces sp. NPDC048639 TaxID=3365581 RepID=UPI00371F6F8D